MYKLIGKNIESNQLLDEYEDDLNIIGTNNEDGTKTIYIFDDNVKYLDENGNINYISDSSVDLLSATTSDAIYTSTVASNYSTTNYNSYMYDYIGTSDSLGVTRTYVKFDLSALEGIDYDDIQSASYNTRLLSTSSAALTKAEVYFVKSNWNPLTITWDNKPDYYGTEKICTQNMCVLSLLEESDPILQKLQRFYITQAVQGWLQGLNNYGIVLIAKNDEGLTQLSSNEHDTYPSYLEITYFEDDEKQEATGIVSDKYYYLINKNSKLALSSQSLISGVNAMQKTLASTALQTFKLCYLNNGYYSIKISNTNQCLAVSDSTAVPNGSIIVKNYSGDYTQQWKVIRNWDGSYQFVSRKTNYSMAVKSSSTIEDAQVIQYPHSINFYKQDDWTLVPAQKGEVSLYGFSEECLGSFDTSSNLYNIKNYLSSVGYNPSIYEDCSATSGYNTLQSSEIWHFAGHGDGSAMLFKELTGTKSWLYYLDSDSADGENLKNLSSSALNKLQLCTIAACLTGIDRNGYNLIGGMYQKGSHFCMAYTNSVLYGASDNWYWYFYLSVSSGHDILYSINYADIMVSRSVSSTSNIGHCIPKHILGDTSIFFAYDDCPSHIVESSNENLKLNMDSAVGINANQINTLSVEKSIYVGCNLVDLKYISTTPQNEENIRYDIYSDEFGGLYEFDSGTNTLISYIPYYDSSKCGDGVIDKDKALECAEEFLRELGYNLDGFEIKTSNNYSKEFTVEYVYYDNGNISDEKIVVDIIEDEKGEIFVSYYKAFNYGCHSKTN